MITYYFIHVYYTINLKIFHSFNLLPVQDSLHPAQHNSSELTNNVIGLFGIDAVPTQAHLKCLAHGSALGFLAPEAERRPESLVQQETEPLPELGRAVPVGQQEPGKR